MSEYKESKMPSDAQFHVNENTRAARAAHLRLMQGEPNELYVYFKPRRLEALSEIDDHEGWTLAWPERVPSNMTADQLVYWFASRSARVPYLID